MTFPFYCEILQNPVCSGHIRVQINSSHLAICKADCKMSSKVKLQSCKILTCGSKTFAALDKLLQFELCIHSSKGRFSGG